MSKMLSLLKSAAGEVSLLSRIGQWMQAVSDAIDAAADPAYIQVHRASSNQSVNFTNADDIVLNASGGRSGIGYDTGTGVFTLQVAGFYELEFYGTWVNFGTPNTTVATVDWTDLAGTPLVTGHSSWGVAASSTLNNAPQPSTKVLYRAAAGDKIKLKASTTGGGGTAELQRGASFAIVRRVGN